MSLHKTGGVSLRKHGGDDLAGPLATSLLSPDSGGRQPVSLDKRPDSYSAQTFSSQPHTTQTQSLRRAPLPASLVPAMQPRLTPGNRPILGKRAFLALAVAVAAGIAAFAMGRSGTPSATSNARISQTAPSPIATSASVADPPTPSAVVPPPSTPTPAPPDPRLMALRQLAGIRAGDVQTVAFSGQWVAQLASKLPGIVDPLQTTSSGSHTFAATDILDEYTTARNNADFGSDVRLLLSTDYGNRQLYKGKPLWVTVAMVSTFTSAQDVNTWCAQQFPALSGNLLADSCTARTLDPPR
ncbi:MAG: hypothetical protein ABI903_10185 [Actinomycetota bacterium]